MNNQAFFFFYNISHRYDNLDKLIIFFAVYFPYIVIVLAGLFLLFHHEVFKAENPFRLFLQKKKEILKVFFTGGIAWVIVQALKFLIHFSRPFDSLKEVRSLFAETGYAFPSGHASFFMALAVSIFLLHKRAGYVFMFFALIIGLARIIAGVHFPLDILSGFALGALVAYFLKNV